MIRKITNTILMLRTIRHYRRMIALAKTLPEGERVDIFKMRDAIGEHWQSESCPYCLRYQKNLICFRCPLGNSHNCCDGLWKKMNKSRTWGEWIERAKAVKKYVWRHGMKNCIQGVNVRCQKCGKLEFRRIQDTDAMFVNGFMILPDRWICDECLPEMAYEIAREMQAERDRKLGYDKIN